MLIACWKVKVLVAQLFQIRIGEFLWIVLADILVEVMKGSDIIVVQIIWCQISSSSKPCLCSFSGRLSFSLFVV